MEKAVLRDFGAVLWDDEPEVLKLILEPQRERPQKFLLFFLSIQEFINLFDIEFSQTERIVFRVEIFINVTFT